MHRSKQNAQLQRLIGESAGARRVLAADLRALRHKFNAPERLRHSLITHPLHWLGSSAALGLITSRLFRRRKRPRAKAHSEPSAAKQGGILLTLLGLAFTTLRPVAQTWATARVKRYVGDRVRYGSTRSPGGTNFRHPNPL